MRYFARMACTVSNLSYRKLDYMIRDGFFTPDLPATGKDSTRGFSFRDLLALRCVGNLRAAGVSLQAVRKVDRALRAYGRDLAGAHLVVTEKGREREVYVYDHAALIALLAKPGQTAWATIVDLGRCAADVQAIVDKSETPIRVKRKTRAA